MGLRVQTTTRQRLAALFCVPLAFSLLFFISSQWADRTDLALLQIQNLSFSIRDLFNLSKDIEAGEQGFLLTGDETYLGPYLKAKALLPSQIDLCRGYAKDRPEQAKQVEVLIGLIKERLEEATKVLDTQQDQNFAAALALMKTGRGRDTMNSVTQSVFALQKSLDQTESHFLERQTNLNHVAFFIFVAGTAIMIVVLVWLYNAVMSYIHDRDAAQGQLQALNAELEARIDERTRELKASNEELQQFAYVASHDLQEPLRTITSFTQLLSSRYQGKLDDDADEFIGYIVTSSRRMTDLINGLLALVRLRKKGQSTNPVALDEVLEEAEASLQASIRESGARLEKSPLPALVVDKVQITQVLQNLISNSIKYRAKEPPVIRVGARRDATDWVISVADNGLGFEQQYAERIFGIFQRLHGREVEGTGMGLSIARRIIERHGGRIWAESQLGVGSTFFFSLPASLERNREGLVGDAVGVIAGSH